MSEDSKVKPSADLGVKVIRKTKKSEPKRLIQWLLAKLGA